VTRNENRQRIKNEALNKITQIYHPKYAFPYDDDDYTPAEQREFAVRRIVEELKWELDKV